MEASNRSANNKTVEHKNYTHIHQDARNMTILFGLVFTLAGICLILMILYEVLTRYGAGKSKKFPHGKATHQSTRKQQTTTAKWQQHKKTTATIGILSGHMKQSKI